MFVLRPKAGVFNMNHEVECQRDTGVVVECPECSLRGVSKPQSADGEEWLKKEWVTMRGIEVG